MLGTIRTRHLVLHAGLIVRLFGFRTYARCVANAVLHRQQCTFLGSLGPAPDAMTQRAGTLTRE